MNLKNKTKGINSIPLPKKMTGKGTEKYKIVAGTVDDLLQLTVYVAKEKFPTYDVFIDKSNEDWITHKYYNGVIKYSVAMLDKLIYYYYCKFLISNEKVIQEYFQSDETGCTLLSDIVYWQENIREKQNDARLKTKFDKWDQELSVVPNNVPDNFKEYMRKKSDGRYFMFFKDVKSTIGYCSRCKEEVPLIKAPKQNEVCKCPSCKKKAILKRQSQIATLETNWYNGAYIQKIGDILLIRKYSGIQTYRGCDYKNPKVKLEENVRYILYKDGKVSRFWHGMYNNCICRWIKNTYVNESWATIHTYYDYCRIKNVYTRNLYGILKRSSWSCWKKKPCDLARYLLIEHQTNGLVEKLVRIGLYNIAKSFMEIEYVNFKGAINPEGKDLGQILKIDNARLKRLIKNDSVSYYKWLKFEKQRNTILDDDMLHNFAEMNLNSSSFNFLPQQMSFKQINNYIVKQAQLSSEDYNQVLTTWKDYLAMAKRNGWDLDSSLIYKPTDLKEMHTKAILFKDGSSMEKETKELEEKWPEVNKNLSLMKKFEYENDKYCILVPDGIKDIVREGHSLQHCIHQVDYYFEHVTNRETYIFFLRKQEKRSLSWYTLEVEQNGNILQKRTTGDNQNKDLNEALPFLKEFQQFFIQQMNEEDKLLGEKAEKNRKKRYAELREKNSKIWHGKLAGKLLADVLEADLMVA